MKQYNIYSSPLGMTEAVKLGWSWPAFFFGPIWAMVKKMWLLGSLTLIGLLVLYSIFGSANQLLMILVDLFNLGIYIIFGIQGNSWRESNLISRGFKRIGIVTAANPEGALAAKHMADTTHEMKRTSIFKTPLVYFFTFLGMTLGQQIGRDMNPVSVNQAGTYVAVGSMVCGLVAGGLGFIIASGINAAVSGIVARILLKWVVGVIGLFVFTLMFAALNK